MASEQMRQLIELMSLPRDRTIPITQQRENMELGTTMFPALTLEFVPVDANGVPSEWVVPSAPTGAVVLYLHGGAYVAGSPRTHRNLTTRIAEGSQVRVLAIDYRLAPEDPHPAAVEDAVAAYRFLLDSGYEPERIAVAGDSAGGGLTIALLVSLRDEGLPMPSCVVPISPWVDLEGVGASWSERDAVDPIIDADDLRWKGSLYAGDTDPRTPTASPIYADLTGLPPMLVLVGDAEVLLDDSLTLARNARAAGVDVTLDHQPEMIHVWPLFAGLAPECDEAVERINEYLGKHLVS